MKKSRIVALIAAIIGAVDAAYLTWVKLSHNEAACTPGFGDCYTVNTSRYAEVYGIPVAIFGLAAYLFIIVLLLSESKTPFLRENGNMILFGVSLIGVLYSAYLSYLEEFVIHAWCPYCILSALAMLTIFIASILLLKDEEEV